MTYAIEEFLEDFNSEREVNIYYEPELNLIFVRTGQTVNIYQWHYEYCNLIIDNIDVFTLSEYTNYDDFYKECLDYIKNI